MPSAITLVLKNASSVDKTFALLAPSAGYGSVAEWALKEGAISSIFPRITSLVRSANPLPGRASSKICLFKFRVPSSFTDTVTGLTNVASAFEADVKVTVPADFPEAMKDDAIAFLGNALIHTLFKSVIKDGAPAT